ncbi:MAG: hypothetical protein LUC30_08415 [Clostridiales bacterium]|nr:hypothetical protein [Clostridiales bacterium]
MGLTSNTKKFQEQLTQLINTCGLPLVIIQLCIEVAHVQLDQVISREMAKESAPRRKERDENGDTDSYSDQHQRT